MERVIGSREEKKQKDMPSKRKGESEFEPR